MTATAQKTLVGTDLNTYAHISFSHNHPNKVHKFLSRCQKVVSGCCDSSCLMFVTVLRSRLRLMAPFIQLHQNVVSKATEYFSLFLE